MRKEWTDPPRDYHETLNPKPVSTIRHVSKSISTKHQNMSKRHVPRKHTSSRARRASYLPENMASKVLFTAAVLCLASVVQLAGRGLHSLTSELNLSTFGTRRSRCSPQLQHLRDTPRVNMVYMGDIVSFS